MFCVGEAEELQGRLKASRHRVMDLEKEVSSLQGTVERLEKVANELSSELDKLKLEQKMTSKQLVESDEEKLELHQKLNTKTNDCAALQQELQGKVSQLSLTQLRVQQVCLDFVGFMKNCVNWNKYKILKLSFTLTLNSLH